MVINPKIIKVTSAIEKVKEQIAELQAKLKDLEKQKTQLENDEIVAMFRREKLNEDEFAAILQAGKQKAGHMLAQAQSITQLSSQNLQNSHNSQSTSQITARLDKEDGLNADN